MSDERLESEAIQRELQLLDLEEKRLDLALKREALRARQSRWRRFSLSPPFVPLVAAVFALLGSGITSYVQGMDRHRTLALERQRFELEVTSKILQQHNQRQAATRLLFLSRTGYITLNDRQRARLARFALGDPKGHAEVREDVKADAAQQEPTAGEASPGTGSAGAVGLKRRR